MVSDSMLKHKTWNNGWVDNTWRPITPPLETTSRSSFRAAITEYLPTPPASTSSERSRDGTQIAGQSSKPDESFMPFRYASPPMELTPVRPSFRRRMGRGGRMWIDRRSLRAPKNLDDGDTDSRLLERMEYDVEMEDDTEVFHTDPYDDWNLRLRTSYNMASPTTEQQRKLAEEAARRNQLAMMAARQGLASGTNSSPTRPVAAAR